MSAPILKPSDSAIAQAADCLKAGGLVAIPTETVYGLACDASNADAVARLYEVKGRPRFNPLISHVDGLAMARREAAFSDLAQRLADFYWPGPLTLVQPAKPSGTVCDLARAGLDTVALRQPAHGVAHDLIAAFGGPLVAPSANRSGRISPVTAGDVAEELGKAIDFILDGGRCAVGLESTVLGLAGDTPVLLRPGGLAREALERFLERPLAAPGPTTRPASPGQLARHYAPNAVLRLNANKAEPGEVLIGFGPMTADHSLSASGDLREAAANLFPLLRELDRTHSRIAIAPIPDTGLGEAINDRLRRAATRPS